MICIGGLLSNKFMQYIVLLLATAAFCAGFGGLPWAAAVAVALHELGHFTAARLLGIKIRKIELEPGGVRMETNLRCISFAREAAFLLAGPVANAAAALVWTGAGLPFSRETWAANMALFGINLLPAFPLDGGRLLYEAVARRRGIGAGKRAAAACGAVMGTLAVLAGACVLFVTRYNFTLALFGAFILVYIRAAGYMGSFAEAELRRGMLEGRSLYRSRLYTALPSMKAVEAVKAVPAGAVIAVADSGGRILGFLTYGRICGAVVEYGCGVTLGEVLCACGGKDVAKGEGGA